MMRSMFLLFVANHASRCSAWSWTTHQTPQDPEPRTAPDVLPDIFDGDIDFIIARVVAKRGPGADLSQAGRDALFTNNDALQAYRRKPDCFQDVIASVRARCEESRMDEQDRIHAAIGMTLCELATARHYLPPMECAAYAGASDKDKVPSQQGQARCVDALSRSAQFWSSYSGYLREMPQLCFTFRRWIDIDTAKDIYRNITEEKAIFVRFLTEREKSSKTTHQVWKKTAEDMRDMVEALRLASDAVKDTSDILAMAVLDTSQSLLAEVQNTFQKIEERDRVNLGEVMTKFHSMLENVQRDHSDNLLGLLPAIQSSITFELSTAFGLIREESLRNMDAAAHVEHQLGLVETGLVAMQNSLAQLVQVMEGSSKWFEASLVQAQTAHAIQDDTMTSMARLVDTVHLLTQTTHDEITSINQTASALKENLGRSPGSELLKAVLVSLLQIFPGIDTAINPLLLQFTFRIVCTIWHGTRFIASLFVSGFILVQTREWLRLAPRTPPYDREAQGEATCDMDIRPPVRPRTRLAQGSLRPRYSRIPDRLCRPSEDAK